MRKGRIPKEVMLLQKRDRPFGELVQRCSVPSRSLPREILHEGDAFLQNVAFLLRRHLAGAFVGVAMEGDLGAGGYDGGGLGGKSFD